MEKEGYWKQLLGKFASETKANAFSLYDGKTITEIPYAQFACDILKSIACLRKNGIFGQNVAIISPNSYDWVTAFFAVVCSGNVAVMLNPDLPESILESQCVLADVSVICGAEDVLPGLGSVAAGSEHISFEMLKACDPCSFGDVHDATEDDTVLMMFTSGTTGKSKAVKLTTGNLRYSMLSFQEPFTRKGMERVLTPIPYYHILGFSHVLEALIFRDTVCIGRGVKYLFQDMPALNPTSLSAVPVILESLTKILKNTHSPKEREKYIGSDLQTVTFGGASLKPEVGQFLLDSGLIVYMTYGMTEMGSIVTGGTLDLKHIRSVGKFCAHIEHRFQDGELLLGGPNVMKGYYKDPEATREKVIDGWLHTGDLGHCDGDGYYYITGRKKNLIILSNGENVSPEELEAKFAECPAILECMVYSDGKGICADIYTDQKEISAEYIRSYNSGVPMYRQVYKVTFTEKPLEKTGNGKIKRKGNA